MSDEVMQNLMLVAEVGWALYAGRRWLTSDKWYWLPLLTINVAAAIVNVTLRLDC